MSGRVVAGKVAGPTPGLTPPKKVHSSDAWVRKPLSSNIRSQLKGWRSSRPTLNGFSTGLPDSAVNQRKSLRPSFRA
jgi:hypothetical protein